MSRKLWPSLVMLAAGAGLLVAAAFAGPAESEGAAAEARKGGTLRLSESSDVDSVDSGIAYYPDSAVILHVTCARLLTYPDKAGVAGIRLVPEVARAFPTISKDGRTYTLELRRTFRFHTGAPVTAQSFADAFNRDANPKLKSLAVNFLRDIVGAEAVIAGRTTRISGVRVLGRYRLQIRLKKARGDLTARLTMSFFCPIPPNTPVDPKGIDDPAGSGPYYVAERVPNRRIVLKRNRYYGGGRPANVDEVVWTIDKDRAGCLAATEQNRVDHCVLFGIPESEFPRLARKYGVNRPGGQFFVGRRLDTWYFAFNHDRPAFKGPGQIALKKAINYAIDRAALAGAAGYLGATADDQMLPPALGRAERIYPLKGDLVLARRWLARARIKPATLVLYALKDRPSAVAAAHVFVGNLKRIGIDVDVRYFDQSTQFGKASIRGAPYDVFLGGWSVDFVDPATFLETLLNGDSIRPKGNFNLSYLDDPRVNARIAAANRLTGAARHKAWADLDADLMRNDPPWAPFLHRNTHILVSRSVGCVVVHPIYGVDIAAACKK